MGSWQDLTLGDIGKAFARYRPFIAAVVAIVMVVAFLPGKPAGRQQLTTDKFAAANLDQGAVAGEQAAAGGDGTAGADGATAGGPTVSAGGTARTSGGSAAGRASGGTVSGGNSAVPVPAKVGPDCDLATGRTKIPSLFAPPCMPIVPKSANGGATSPGVTADTIKLVWYRSKADPAVTAALTAAGASDQWENTQATIKVWADFLNKHYNFAGRQIDMEIFEGTADAKDDAAGIQDAIAVASKKPFAVINAINNAFVDELVHRKIVCICTTSLPNEFYEARYPYAGWTTLMSSTQGYIQRAEFVGKRLWGKKAKWAGFRDSPADPMSDETRVFGLLWYNTPDGLYKVGADFFEKELARYGAKLKVSLGYSSDLTEAQAQTRSLISRLKAEGVTSVVFAGDPITPATFTSEANNQQWQPEWIITGSALTDTSLFGRTYNQDQWSRAFGISFLTLRVPPEKSESYNLHRWHTGVDAPPAAGNTYPVLYAPFFSLGVGLNGAGANLTPETFAKGMFSYPPTGGGVTNPTVSWGRHGIWDKAPWNLIDLLTYDDVTEIFWDRTAPGKDEVGHDGVGMYRYVNNGKRYLPGTQPATDPGAFNNTNAPTTLNDVPENERPPQYERKNYFGS